MAQGFDEFSDMISGTYRTEFIFRAGGHSFARDPTVVDEC
jgi:hypothetical protein